MKIAVDAMGGDYAPEAIVEGAVQAAEEYGFSLILVGQEERVQMELAKYETDHLPIEVRHAPQIVDMHDLPSVALRRKRQSSLHIAINMIKSGEVDAAVSAGNTGAAMAIGKVACRMLEGIDRPALAMGFPNANGVTVVVDVGANVDCKPLHLLQFAVMAHVYAQEVFGIVDPRIGLLSVGEEESKGNTLTKDVFEPLRQSPLNFIGNAEGRDLFNGRVDVLICDGFTGNVMLKVSESLAKTISSFTREAFTKNWRTKLGYLLVKPGMDAMKKRIDHSEYGGAPLLGLNGVVIVGHGSSKARAVKNAIRVAGESVEHHINDQIIEILHNCEFDTKSYARATSLWSQIKRSIRHEGPKEKLEEEKKDRDVVKESEEKPAALPEQNPEEEEQQVAKEHEKRYWWSRRSHDEEPKTEEQNEQHESAVEPEDNDDVAEEAPPGETLSEQESTPEKESEREKKHWWSLKSSSETEPFVPADEEDEHLLNDELQSAETDTTTEESTENKEPENGPEIEESQENDTRTETESPVPKRPWWKRKTQSHQKDVQDEVVTAEEESGDSSES